MDNLDSIAEEITNCTACRLCETRTNTVPGEGNFNAKWVICGEAAGANEDLQGRPFVGKSGELLGRLLLEIGQPREDVFITNILNCRPPNNRDPRPEEVAACKDFLKRQIEAIAPAVITTLGKPAANLLLGTKSPLYKLRGTINTWNKTLVVPTYHPSYIQRGNWDKLDMMRRDLDLALKLAEAFD